MKFVDKLFCAKEPEFEVLLYDEVRSHAQGICLPQLHRADSSTSESTCENEAESNRDEYSKLEECLFNKFEQYISGPELAECASNWNEKLEAQLNSMSTNEPKSCGHIFQSNEPVYCCRDCAVDSTCVFCRTCFFNGIHVKHNYRISTSSGSGYCDCGDPEAWRSGVWCRLHEGTESVSTDKDTKSESDCPILLHSNSVESQLKSESERLQKKIGQLPVDVVTRASRLLQPLINSSIFCFYGLIQGTPNMTTKELSSRYLMPSSEPVSTDNIIDEISDSNGTQVLDSLWAVDDGILSSTPVDDKTICDNWPPPKSHVPLVSLSEDLAVLQHDMCPRTAPKLRSVSNVKARCLAQLERARKYHSRLFPPRSMRTASDRTAASKSFAVVLYNNEFHNYEQVIKTLRRVLDCSTQQATHYAVQINCDGRIYLQVNLTSTQACNMAAVLMRTSTSISSRPIYCLAQHMDIYLMEEFFLHFMRWLQRYCDRVPSLRPVVCHALMGLFAVNANSLTDNDTGQCLPILPHDEMIQEHSFVDRVFERHTLTWRAVRQEVLRMLLGVLLKDNFYRRVFAIKFTRSYNVLTLNEVYDDHFITDNLSCLSCQMFTVLSLARQLLEQNHILTRLISNLEKAFVVNSIALPDFYEPPQNSIGRTTLSTNVSSVAIPGTLEAMDLFSSSTPSTAEPNADKANGTSCSWFCTVVYYLRHMNPSEWAAAESQHADANAISKAIPKPSTLLWEVDNTLGRSWFHPFERLFHCINDINYVLASLTNLRPLAGDSSTAADKVQETWWTESSRNSFVYFFKHFLNVLSYVQDMNGLQRETFDHVEIDTEWASGFFIISYFVSLLGLVVQVASSDYDLYKAVLSEARQVFESRIGIWDRRFRVKSLIDDDFGDVSVDSDLCCTAEMMTKLMGFGALGVTTEMYAYDVSMFRVSLIQPIPRLMANLYAHGLEMGFSLDDLNLNDKEFVNLLVERALQVFSFCAQSNAKMWIRNGFAIQQSMAKLFSPIVRVEMIDRDLQLIQLASCVLQPDEFVVRMIHKFQLGSFFKSQLSREPGPAKVCAVELLLRLLLTCVTHRYRPSIGRFSPNYYYSAHSEAATTEASPSASWMASTATVNSLIQSITLDPNLELHHASLINDVIHTLCLRPMFTYSELLSLLPYQATSSLLLKMESTGQTTHVHSDDSNEMDCLTDESIGLPNEDDPMTTSTSCPPSLPTEHLHGPPSVSRRTNKLSTENVLPQILKHLAVKTTMSNGKIVFSIKPEVMAFRFNRFNWTYRHSEQTVAENNVTKCFKKWIQESNNANLVGHACVRLPLPRPLHEFAPNIRPGPLGLIRSPTFIRMAKVLLDVALNQSSIPGYWSDNLLDLLLHLVIMALYEDEFEFRKTGTCPFLQTVAQVPIEMETDIELKQLTYTKHWLSSSNTDENLVPLNEENCVTSRLMSLLHSNRYQDFADIIKWTLDFWSSLVRRKNEQHSFDAPSPCTTVMASKDSKKSAIAVAKAQQAKARRVRIMERMSNMQRNFMDTFNQSDLTNEDELMDIDKAEIPSAPTTSMDEDGPNESTQALGPNRSLGILGSELANPDYVIPSTLAHEEAVCTLCLEEVVVGASNRMIMTTHVCRSSVLSVHDVGWLEGQATMDVNKRLATNNESLSNVAEQDDDVFGDSDDDTQPIPNKMLSTYLANVATETGASCVASNMSSLIQIPRLISNLKPMESNTNKSTEFGNTDIPVSTSLAACVNQLISTDQSNQDHKVILDPWHPRPLVMSRASVNEEGSFCTFCSHPMHAACKAKYARQLKLRADTANRNRTLMMIAFDFRCPLCKSISTLDVPMLASAYVDMPIPWLQSRLLTSNTARQANSPEFGFQTLSTWLLKLSQWLNMTSNGSANTKVVASVNTCQRNSHFVDQLNCYSLTEFGKLISDLPKLVNSADCYSDALPIYTKLVEAILFRMRTSLLISKDADNLLFNDKASGKSSTKAPMTTSPTTTTTTTASNTSSSSSSRYSIVNSLRRQFPGIGIGSLFNRSNSTTFASSTTPSSVLSSSHSASTTAAATATTSSSSSANDSTQVRNILPSPPEPPIVTTNLFTVVQRLANLCQPKFVDSLIQRPTAGRRAPVAMPEQLTTVPLPNAMAEDEIILEDVLLGWDNNDTNGPQNATAVDILNNNNNDPNENNPDDMYNVIVPVLDIVEELLWSNPELQATFELTDYLPIEPTLVAQNEYDVVVTTAPIHLSTPPATITTSVSNPATPMNTALASLSSSPSSSSPTTAFLNTFVNSSNSDIKHQQPVVSLSAALDQFSADLTALVKCLNLLNWMLSASGPTATNDLNAICKLVQSAVDRVNVTSRTAVSAAANEWRASRHSLAYTLIVSERILRVKESSNNFFNGAMADRHLYGLKHLLRVSLTAQAHYAVVSRGCPSGCSQTNHAQCWPQLVNHPNHWWWWSFCVPSSNSCTSEQVGCRLSNSPSILDIAQYSVRVAVTEDARFLWRLLLPTLNSHEKVVGNQTLKNQSSSTNDQEITFGNDFLTDKPTSLIWEVDIIHLFISLLHLRPGLEDGGAVAQCQCSRLAREANMAVVHESGAGLLGSHLLACDEGRPRHPIGDCHETHLVRLCYTALLVQSLLSWQPGFDVMAYLMDNNLIAHRELDLDKCLKSTAWNNPQLLNVWVLLRQLSGLPSPPNFASVLKSSQEIRLMARQLGLYLRFNCLPFLRIAATLIHYITTVEIPSQLKETNFDFIDQEHCLLLDYLGLPGGPSDLLVVLSNEKNLFDLAQSTEELGTMCDGLMTCAEDDSDLESFWLARLITSWCLNGRLAVSRQLYRLLASRYCGTPLTATNAMVKKKKNTDRHWLDCEVIWDFVPKPNTYLPRLIKLPKEYTTLLLLAVDLDCHTEGRTHSDLSICLVCGHLACLFCYSCREFEQKSTESGQSTAIFTTNPTNNSANQTPNSNSNNTSQSANATTSSSSTALSTLRKKDVSNEYAIYRMQVHSRRCHSGYSFILRIRACRVLLLSDQGRRLTEISAPYRDSFGEIDPGLKRGNPLFLVESEYENMNQLWLSHQLASNSTSELITPLNQQFGFY